MSETDYAFVLRWSPALLVGFLCLAIGFVSRYWRQRGATFLRTNYLRCPFCGEAPRVIEDDSHGCCHVFCVCPVEPGVMLSKGKLELARAVWNVRAGRV